MQTTPDPAGHGRQIPEWLWAAGTIAAATLGLILGILANRYGP